MADGPVDRAALYRDYAASRPAAPAGTPKPMRPLRDQPPVSLYDRRDDETPEEARIRRVAELWRAT